MNLPQVHHRHWPGAPDRPALALHCMMGNGGYWGPIATALQGRLDLRAFDVPGHGRSAPWSPPPPGDPDLHTVVTRLAAGLIERPLDLIGHSFGATVALRIAVGAPHAIRSLTLIEPVLFAAARATAPETLTPDRALGETMQAMLAEGRNTDAARAFIAIWGERPFDALSPALRAQMAAQVPLVAETNEMLMQDSARMLRPGGLEGIDAPVLLVQGAKSPPVIGAIAETIAARLPDVGRAVVPDAGHMLPITHPERVADLIALNLDRA